MIVLIRHGETVWNCEGRKQGRGDSSLTAKGRHQAEMIADSLLNSALLDGDFRIVCSPLGRARSTAELICVQAKMADRKIEFDDTLMEADHGDWEGMTAAEIEAHYPGAMAERMNDHWNYQFPGGESYYDLAVRVRKWQCAADTAATSIVVTHEMISRVVRKQYSGCTVDQCLAMEHRQNEYFLLNGGEIQCRRIEIE